MANGMPPLIIEEAGTFVFHGGPNNWEFLALEPEDQWGYSRARYLPKEKPVLLEAETTVITVLMDHRKN